jgi:hypothetical protein
MRVGVRVAVDVLELDEAAEPLVATDRPDPPVVDGDHPRAALGEDLDAAALLAGLDDDGLVALALHLLMSRSEMSSAYVAFACTGSGPG